MAVNNTQNSPANYSPYLRGKSMPSVAWETTGNTCVVSDANVHTNSLVVIVNTSARNGLWSWVCTEGTITITSSDSESATTTTFKYQAF